jgi:DNA-binding IclR family transcriptional regulator
MTATARKTIGSLQRAIDILDAFDEQTPALGITEISEQLALHKSTVAGLVYTLERNRYLEQYTATRKYRLGLKLVERAFTMLDQVDVRSVALPHLQALRDRCNDSVFLAVRDGGHVVYIEQLVSSQPLGMRAKLGYRAPVQTTALGKAILSALSQGEVEQLVSTYGLPLITAKSITDPVQFMQELDQARSPDMQWTTRRTSSASAVLVRRSLTTGASPRQRSAYRLRSRGFRRLRFRTLVRK